MPIIEVGTGRWYDAEEDRWRERDERPPDPLLVVFSRILAEMSATMDEAMETTKVVSQPGDQRK